MMSRLSLSKLLGLILAVLMSAPCSHADQTLLYGFIEFPPFIYLDENNKAVGSVIDQVINPILATSSYRIKYLPYPPKRFYAELARGRFDFNVASVNPVVLAGAHFGRRPLFEIVLALFSKNSLDGINGLADIRGSRLGGLRGFNFIGAITFINEPGNKLRLHRVNNRSSLYKLLDINRVDYVLDYLGPAATHLAGQPSYQFSHLVLENFPCYIVVPKARPGAQLLLESLESVLLKAKTPVAQ